MKKKASYTPSPWLIRKDKGMENDILRQDGGLLATCYPEDYRRVYPTEESKANARLAAAAPDLLEALDFWFPRIVGNFEGRSDEYDTELDKARAAIAKATQP